MIIVEGLPPEAKEDELIALDTELFGMQDGKLHRPIGEFACLSIAMEHHPNTVYQFYDYHDLPTALERLKAGRWIFQNAVFDLRQMRRWAQIPPRPIWDTMLVDQELWGGYYSSFDLNSLSIRYLEQAMEKDTREEFSKRKAHEIFAMQVAIDPDNAETYRSDLEMAIAPSTYGEMTPQMKEYAALDALSTLQIAQCQMDYIVENDEPFDFYWQADDPMTWVVLDMPPARIDVGGWQNLAQGFSDKAEAIKARLSFNPGSWQQVSAAIKEITGYKLPSTDEDHLEELKVKLTKHKRSEHIALLDDILAYRHYSKAAGTYGMNWIEKYVEDGEWVYTNWKICGASDTSRMSATDPALQTIPARKIPEFRDQFIASKGHIVVGADVAQQEVRILGKLSGDKNLLAALGRGESPHITTGKMIFSDPTFTKADKARYTVAKEINLGIPYGMSAAGIASKAGITEAEASVHLATYFRGFPSVKVYMDTYRRDAMKHEFVRNALGRRCWVNLHYYGWKNNAINAPIQSTAAHQTKIAGAYIHQEAPKRGLPFCLTMFIHDEIVCDVPAEYKEPYIQLLTDAWTEAGRQTLGDTIPVVAEPFYGPTWGEKK
jgi:DNA polymerase I-like protein with 3'-5' exonuclease and polymerase domains